MEKPKSIVELGHELWALRLEKEDLEGQLKEINKAKAKLEDSVVPEAMMLAGVTKITLKDIGTLYLKSAVQAHILANDHFAAFQWLKNHGHGDLIKETIHWKTLVGFVEEQTDQAVKLPDWFKVNHYSKAVIRKS